MLWGKQIIIPYFTSIKMRNSVVDSRSDLHTVSWTMDESIRFEQFMPVVYESVFKDFILVNSKMTGKRVKKEREVMLQMAQARELNPEQPCR